MELSRSEYWSGLPFPSPGYLPNSGIKPVSPASQADSLPTEPPGKPNFKKRGYKYKHKSMEKNVPQGPSFQTCKGRITRGKDPGQGFSPVLFTVVSPEVGWGLGDFQALLGRIIKSGARMDSL